MLSITRPVLTSSFRLLFRYQDGIRIPGSTLMELRYNASQFTPGCTAEHARDFCSPCSTVIDHHHIMCYDCFNQSFATLPNATDYAQVRLPIDRRNDYSNTYFRSCCEFRPPIRTSCGCQYQAVVLHLTFMFDWVVSAIHYCTISSS